MLSIFGAVAVTTMVIAYGLEQRHPLFVALFAVACSLSSAYGFMIDSIPFGVAECLWAVLAAGRFVARQRPVA